MKLKLELTVNGQTYDLLTEPNKTLLDVLRDQLGLMGAKRGCGHGNCGACTVLIDGKAVNSCLILVGDVGGKNISTIEGLAAGTKLHPLQEAFMKHGAIQCGYCTPGMILNAKALLDETPNPTEAEIKTALEGNLCRCTGYTKIIQAIQAVAGTTKL